MGRAVVRTVNESQPLKKADPDSARHLETQLKM